MCEAATTCLLVLVVNGGAGRILHCPQRKTINKYFLVKNFLVAFHRLIIVAKLCLLF